jgi:hypothetical protein
LGFRKPPANRPSCDFHHFMGQDSLARQSRPTAPVTTNQKVEIVNNGSNVIDLT